MLLLYGHVSTQDALGILYYLRFHCHERQFIFKLIKCIVINLKTPIDLFTFLKVLITFSFSMCLTLQTLYLFFTLRLIIVLHY